MLERWNEIACLRTGVLHGKFAVNISFHNICVLNDFMCRLKEKFNELSDGFIVHLNRKTGLLAIGNPDNGTLRDDHTDVCEIALGFSCKLLFFELLSIGVGTRMIAA